MTNGADQMIIDGVMMFLCVGLSLGPHGRLISICQISSVHHASWHMFSVTVNFGGADSSRLYNIELFLAHIARSLNGSVVQPWPVHACRLRKELFLL